MKIVARAFWDDEARVWVAVADGDIGLVTEAKTIEELSRKLPGLAADLFEDECDGSIDVKLLISSQLDSAA